MKRNKTIILIMTAIAMLLVSIAVVVYQEFFTKGKDEIYLVLSNNETGEIYASYPLEPQNDNAGGESKESGFSVMFIHSVNQTPVYDVYKIHDDKIYLESTVYYAFGAGVPTELEEGQTLSRGDDGSMIISGYHRLMDNLIYSVSVVYDHVLIINGEEISLGDLCGKQTHVRFTLRDGDIPS